MDTEHERARDQKVSLQGGQYDDKIKKKTCKRKTYQIIRMINTEYETKIIKICFWIGNARELNFHKSIYVEREKYLNLRIL